MAGPGILPSLLRDRDYTYLVLLGHPIRGAQLALLVPPERSRVSLKMLVMVGEVPFWNNILFTYSIFPGPVFILLRSHTANGLTSVVIR